MSPLPKFGQLPDTHHVPDLLAPGLKLVFCGTALGRVSAEQKAYYANPNNYFWRALHEAGFTPTLLKPQDYPQLLHYRIGLTDLAKRHFGNDAELPEDAFDTAALREKIEEHQPAILAFTSKTGAAAMLERPTGATPYGFQPERIGDTRLFVLPSPSGQARTYWKPKPWLELAEAVRALP